MVWRSGGGSFWLNRVGRERGEGGVKFRGALCAVVVDFGG